MKRSKHFRKDVVIARVIFCVICAVILALVTSVVTTLLENKKDSEAKDSETEHFVSESTILDTEPDTEIETDSQQEKQYVIATVNVKLRKEPNTNCEVIATVNGGDRLLLLEEQAGWYKVLYQEKEGFVSADYARKEVIESETEGGEGNELNRSDYTIMIDPAGEQLHFDIGTLLKQELESRGYVTKITRNIDENNVTAQQRVAMAAQAGADITIGIHTGKAEDTSVSGASAIAPSSANTSVGTLAESCQKLSQEIINAYCTQTGMENDGVMIDDTKEEINYASMPTTVISLGYMSNPSDSSNMQDSAYQKKMVQAIADGIDVYFTTVQYFAQQ